MPASLAITADAACSPSQDDTEMLMAGKRGPDGS
jgi:hypothetical protein